MVSNPGCPGNLGALAVLHSTVHSLTKERRILSFLLRHTKKRAAALLSLNVPKSLAAKTFGQETENLSKINSSI